MALPASNRLSHALVISLLGALALALTGCGAPDPQADAAIQTDQAAVAQAAGTSGSAQAERPSNTQPMPTSPVDLSVFDKLSDAQLRSGHALAVKEGRFLDPATNNAATYLLAMRHRFGPEGIQSQLTELTTEVLVRAELANQRSDLAERTRFIQILEAIDPTLPSLPRLKAMELGQDAWGETLAQAPTLEEGAIEGEMQPEGM